MKVKEESEKVDLKLNIQKTKIMASGPITSWQIVTDFILGGSKITADGDCNHEIKRHLLLGSSIYLGLSVIFYGLPWWLRQLRICLQCRRPRFNPWVGKIPWRREWQPTRVCLSGQFCRQRSLGGYSPWGCKSWTRLSN